MDAAESVSNRLHMRAISCLACVGSTEQLRFKEASNPHLGQHVDRGSGVGACAWRGWSHGRTGQRGGKVLDAGFRSLHVLLQGLHGRNRLAASILSALEGRDCLIYNVHLGPELMNILVE